MINNPNAGLGANIFGLAVVKSSFCVLEKRLYQATRMRSKTLPKALSEALNLAVLFESISHAEKFESKYLLLT